MSLSKIRQQVNLKSVADYVIANDNDDGAGNYGNNNIGGDATTLTTYHFIE